MKVKCPVCGKKAQWKGNKWRPFCSERCKLIDLGKWAGEEYKIEEEKGQRGPPLTGMQAN